MLFREISWTPVKRDCSRFARATVKVEIRNPPNVETRATKKTRLRLLEGDPREPQWEVMQESHPSVAKKRKCNVEEEDPRKRINSGGQNGNVPTMAGIFGSGFAAFSTKATGFADLARPSKALFAPAEFTYTVVPDVKALRNTRKMGCGSTASTALTHVPKSKPKSGKKAAEKRNKHPGHGRRAKKEADLERETLKSHEGMNTASPSTAAASTAKKLGRIDRILQGVEEEDEGEHERPSLKASTAQSVNQAPSIKKCSATKKGEGEKLSTMGEREKEEIAAGINLVPDDVLGTVLAMIKADRPSVEVGDDDKLELDIDLISTPVLWKIHLLVMEYAPKVKTASSTKETTPRTKRSQGVEKILQSLVEDDDEDGDMTDPPKERANLKATLGTSTFTEHLKQGFTSEEQRIRSNQARIDARPKPKPSIHDDPEIRAARLAKKLAKFDKLEGTEDDTIPESPYKDMSLRDQLKYDMLPTNAVPQHMNDQLVGDVRPWYGDGDDPEFVHDMDNVEVNYDYEEEDKRDDDTIRKAKMEKEDPTYDPDFVAEEVHNAAYEGVRMPDYQPKEKEPEKEDVEAAKAWKTLNVFRNDTVSVTANEEYKTWHDQVTRFFAPQVSGSMNGRPFPRIVGQICGVSARDCVKGEELGICQHDVLRVLKGSGTSVDGVEWLERLKRERLRWHPDKFSGGVNLKWAAKAKELFQMVQALTEREER